MSQVTLTQATQPNVEKLARMVSDSLAAQYQTSQPGQQGRDLGMQPVEAQPVVDEQRFLNVLLDLAVNHVVPEAVKVVQNLVAGGRRAYGMPDSRDMGEMQRGIFDFLKDALPTVLTTVSTIAGELARPRQRGGNTDETTDRFLPFLLPIISAVAPAAISAIGNALSGQRGPVSITNDEDQRFLLDFVNTTVTNCFQPSVLNPMISKLQGAVGRSPSLQQPPIPQQYPQGGSQQGGSQEAGSRPGSRW